MPPAYKNKRILDTRKHSSWIFEWIHANLSTASAIVVLFGHADRFMKASTLDDALLEEECKFHRVTEGSTVNEVEGCYLYKAPRGWVRSGKVVGGQRNIGKRHEEHLAASTLQSMDDLKSTFYTTYPSAKATADTSNVAKASFESLRLYVGVGFLRSNTQAVEAICCTNASTALLNWPQDALDRIKDIKFHG